MSQSGRFIPTSGPGSGSVTSVSGGNNITITGNPTVNPTVNVSGTTNHDVLIGNATSSISSVTNGTTGQVLTATTGGDPSWQNASAGGIVTIDGDSGSVTGSTVNIVSGLSTINSGSSVGFFGLGTTLTLDLSDVNNNTLIGSGVGNALITGNNNVALGITNFQDLRGGSDNVAIGSAAGIAITSANGNTLVGSGAGVNLLTGSSNILIGGLSGTAYASSESNNIILGPSTGTAATSGEMFLGDFANTSTTYIAGVQGVTVSNTNAVTINTSTGQLGSQAFPASSISITGDTGGALTGAAFTFTGGSTGLTFAGSGSTETLGGELVVTNGGTGVGSFTAYAPVCGGTTTTGVLQSADTGISNSGYILTSTGATSLPTWQAASGAGIGTLDGDTGSATGSTVTIAGGAGITTSASGSTVTITATGTTGLNYTNVNTTPYTVLITDDFLSVDCSGGAIVVNLPNTPVLGQVFTVKDRTGSAAPGNTITITTLGGTTNIDGATTFVMNTAYEAVDIIGNGSTYEIF